MSWNIFNLQPELWNYEGEINARMDRLAGKAAEILTPGQSLADFANGHMFYGLHRTESGWIYREWAPAAEALHLMGDFNNWDRWSHPLHPIGNGNWEIYIDGTDSLWHQCKYKVTVTHNGETQDRLPLYTFYTYQDEVTKDFCGMVWAPSWNFEWRDGGFEPKNNVPPIIYEAHVGMSSEDRRVASYREFADNTLPRIRDDGYNTVQLMAIMEHPYYGSFGYQVSNFFAPSSRFGSPDDLKHLVNRAHELGLNVLLDLVHSHAVINLREGINCFDGTVYQFFHDGAKGDHPAWGSKVFDYSRPGVLHFLLSNLKYWLDEFHFDGFRFDGVTSMLYHHHGLGVDFTPDKYFTMATDVDAITYLQLATELIHQVKPHAVLVAEDMSAMPGMCLPVSDGGIGFDYRLSMGLPDFFTRTVKDRTDGYWDMWKMSWELLSRRGGEKNVAYLESHDQAIVGSQTFISQMLGGKIYDSMGRWNNDPFVQRAISLLKLMRLAVCCTGDGYLNFMGNEYGHPEWIDFPREGNNWSYDYCRRQWSLADNPGLRYQQLGDFDRAMVYLIRENNILSSDPAKVIRIHQDDQILAFERNNFLFVFNFHPDNPQLELFLPAPVQGDYQAVLSSDDWAFGGEGRISKDYVYHTWDFDPSFGPGFKIYLPPRTAVVLKKL